MLRAGTGWRVGRLSLRLAEGSGFGGRGSRFGDTISALLATNYIFVPDWFHVPELTTTHRHLHSTVHTTLSYVLALINDNNLQSSRFQNEDQVI
jgi:hypothetical protein